MKTVSVTEFKAHCLRMIEEVRETQESIELTRRGKIVAVVTPPPRTEPIDWTPGAFKDSIKIVGDLDDLGVEWEAMR